MKDIYVLSNYTNNTTEINLPLKHTQRVKYTCFDASTRYLVFGASSGSLYIFQRKPCKFLQLIPSKYRAITNVSISPNEKYIAFATQRGVICVLVINISANSIPQLITVTIGRDGRDGGGGGGGGGGGIGGGTGTGNESNGMNINCIHWSADEKQFYFGNRKGEVYLVTLTFFMGKTLLDMSVHPILFLDSSIVQISEFESLLLVSNQVKCILCNMDYEEYKQIGNQPRDGSYGACFSIISSNDYLSSRIYCARPGSRIWEVNLEGNVLQTHEFKSALACSPTKVLENVQTTDVHHGIEEEEMNDDDEEDNMENIYPPQNLPFSKLQIINESNFILTFTSSGLYILDPRDSSVILWTNKFKGIFDCIVIGNEIVVFTNSGHVHTIYLQTVQSYATDLIHQQKMSQCIQLVRRNLKYFAEKAKEDYDLLILEEIKTHLIQNSQYELLNDLSVVFDCLTLRKDNSSIRQHRHQRRLGNGVYVLENAFCDNLKNKQSSDKHIKDMLLTVTGKFGKNIIKYKFNIFNEEQKSLVQELIPSEKNIPFQEIYEQCENENDIICNHAITKKEVLDEQVVSQEEKTVYDLYLIWKSSKISNICFLDRYRTVFDRYTSQEIINLLGKLEKIMIENDDTCIEARSNCYEMYFNYLKPELLWEVDDATREYITDGFILLNTSEMICCDHCAYPIQFTNNCHFREIGETLFKFYQSRNEQLRCLDLTKKVPSIMDVLCRYYTQENQFNKVIVIAMNFGDANLLEEVARHFDIMVWERCFDLFASIQNGKFMCVNCERIVWVRGIIEKNPFYTWNCFLSIALNYLEAEDVLSFILKYSNLIPNNCIEREIFIRCLLK